MVQLPISCEEFKSEMKDARKVIKNTQELLLKIDSFIDKMFEENKALEELVEAYRNYKHDSWQIQYAEEKFKKLNDHEI